MEHERRIRLSSTIAWCVMALLTPGIVLPALRYHRAGAARAMSANNLKQIALAVHNYDAANQKLPPLTDIGPGVADPEGLRSIFCHLLPYVYSSYDMAIYARNKSNGYFAHSSVEFRLIYKGEEIRAHGGSANQYNVVFVSPADQTLTDKTRDIPVEFSDGTTGYYAPCSYAANGLVFDPPIAAKLKLADLDYQTILFAERPQLCVTSVGEKVYNLWGFGGYGPQIPAFALLTPNEPAGLYSTGQVAPVLPLWNKWSPQPAPIRVGRIDAAPTEANFATPFQVVVPSTPCDPRLPGTPHTSGMLVALTDGSVRAVAPTISHYTFWQACLPEKNKLMHKDW